jgi:hypothetical protein
MTPQSAAKLAKEIREFNNEATTSSLSTLLSRLDTLSTLPPPPPPLTITPGAWKDRQGLRIIIVSTEWKGKQPCIGYWEKTPDEPATWGINGRYNHDGRESKCDLLTPWTDPAPSKPVVKWEDMPAWVRWVSWSEWHGAWVGLTEKPTPHENGGWTIIGHLRT